MRKIDHTNAFDRDFKRLSRGKFRNTLQHDLPLIVQSLANDERLPEKNRDHDLGGQYRGYRECHIKPDLLLVYQVVGDDTLILFRLGSHSELFK